MSLESLIGQAVIGQDADDFLKSPVGRYLLNQADNEIEEAVQKLKDVSPWRRRRITELQNDIWRAQSFKLWIARLIIEGKQAERMMDEQEA